MLSQKQKKFTSSITNGKNNNFKPFSILSMSFKNQPDSTKLSKKIIKSSKNNPPIERKVKVND